MSEGNVGLGLFDADNMSSGGFQGGRARINSLRCVQTQFDKAKPREPMVIANITDGAGEDHELRYGLGKDSPKRFEITEGGKRFKGRNGATLNKSCKAALFANSLVKAGFEFPAKAMPKSAGESPDLSVVDGTVVEFEQVVMDVGDKIKQERKTAGKGDITVLIVKTIIDDADEVPASKGSKAADEPEAEAGEGDADSEALETAFKELLKGVLADGALDMTSFKTATLKAIEADDTLKEYSDDLMQAVESVETLEGLGFEVADGKDAKGKKAKLVSDPEASPAPAKKGGLFGKKK